MVPPCDALVAQGIEHRPPEPGAQVRILPGAPGSDISGVTHRTFESCRGHQEHRALAVATLSELVSLAASIPQQGRGCERRDASRAPYLVSVKLTAVSDFVREEGP